VFHKGKICVQTFDQMSIVWGKNRNLINFPMRGGEKKNRIGGGGVYRQKKGGGKYHLSAPTGVLSRDRRSKSEGGPRKRKERKKDH